MLEQIIKKLIKEKSFSGKSVAKLKRWLASQSKNPAMVKTSALLAEYHRLVRFGKIKASPSLENLFRTRRVRTLSGVAVVTVLTKPFKCPGRCLYCPDEKGMPKSYLKNEPAAARALMLSLIPIAKSKLVCAPCA